MHFDEGKKYSAWRGGARAPRRPEGEKKGWLRKGEGGKPPQPANPPSTSLSPTSLSINAAAATSYIPTPFLSKLLAARNLIATDDESFTLMLLCWTPGKESPIHDHPCDGCWMRVVHGTVVETKYARDAANNRLTQLGTSAAGEGTVIYIDDGIALHKVGNPSQTEGACTLHLYSPPFRTCQIWLEQMGEGCGGATSSSSGSGSSAGSGSGSGPLSSSAEAGGTPAGGEQQKGAAEAGKGPVLSLDGALKTVVTYYSEFGEVVLHERGGGSSNGLCK
jgi:hypothetical protein